MNSMVALIIIGVSLFVFQLCFVLSCLRWLANGKRKRDKEFAILDSERAQLLKMQNQLKLEIQEAKKLSSETLNKLRIIGSEAHAEWEDVTKKINSVLIEVDNHSELLLQKNISDLSMRCMALEKIMLEADHSSDRLVENLKRAQKILKLFDKSVPNEEIFKEIQNEKYSEAKKLIAQGIEASLVCKKLGLSMEEIVLLSAYV